LPQQSAGEQRLRALAEVSAATAVYVGLSLGAVSRFDLSRAVTWLSTDEASVVSGFLVGSLAQLGALGVIWLAARPFDLAEAVRRIRLASSREGWAIAAMIIAIECVVMLGFFLEQPVRVMEPSLLNLTGSISPLLDGVTQEVFFRGYLILRLARSGFGTIAQLALSSVAFSAIHVGYIGDSWSAALPPMLGTIGLGAALGWSFIRSGHSLRPPIVAHAAILVLIQPWLALAR
jgi:hypothetical protein